MDRGSSASCALSARYEHLSGTWVRPDHERGCRLGWPYWRGGWPPNKALQLTGFAPQLNARTLGLMQNVGLIHATGIASGSSAPPTIQHRVGARLHTYESCRQAIDPLNRAPEPDKRGQAPFFERYSRNRTISACEPNSPSLWRIRSASRTPTTRNACGPLRALLAIRCRRTVSPEEAPAPSAADQVGDPQPPTPDGSGSYLQVTEMDS